MTDKDIYHQVRRDAVAGNSSVGNRTIVHLLDSLVHVYGDDFTIDGAVNALDSLTTMAAIWKDELRKAKAEARSLVQRQEIN